MGLLGMHWHRNGVGPASTGIFITPSLHPRSGWITGRRNAGRDQKELGCGVLPLKLRANRYELALSSSFLCGQAEGK